MALDLDFLVLMWIILCLVFIGIPSVYYLYMKLAAATPWRLKVDKNFTPFITILIPARNEEKSIRFKLDNLLKVKYPREKMEILLINDFSTDKTLEEMSNFLSCHTDLNAKVLNVPEHGGKTKALNYALKYATGDIIVVSDSDCFWSPDILVKALPYLTDKSVGAVTGLEILLNPAHSWVTKTEVAYNDIVHTIRVGESKTHSTIFFQGGFGAYRRDILTEFDPEADDSGSALNIVQKQARTLLIPEAVYFTTFPSAWKDKIAIKVRRAGQLIRIWFKCIRLMLRGELALPKKIFLPEAFLYIFSPIIFLLLIAITLFLTLKYTVFLLPFSAIFVLVLLIEKSRTLLIETVQDNLVLLSALLASMLGKRDAVWKSVDRARRSLNKDTLMKEGLI